MIELPAKRISGRALRTLVSAVRKTPARHVVARVLRAQLGIDALRALGVDQRGDLPASWRPLPARTRGVRASENLGAPTSEGWPHGAPAIAAAYAAGREAPARVAQRALAAARELASRTPSLGPLLEYDDARALSFAKECERRIASGQRLGVLDGVPIAIKEEVDVAGLPTRLGTAFLPSTPAPQDSVAVARLRAAGAVVIGTTPMTEYGMSPLGGNVHRAMPRNAHDPTRLPGGSSSGSAVAVATGVVPVALGTDGGGSVRIPACLNGVFGLKPTFGRIPTTGLGLGGGSSVVHIGPLGATSADLALFLQATAGADDGDPTSAWQPPLDDGELVRALGDGVRGLRIGVVDSEWAVAPTDVVTPAKAALDALVNAGAQVVSVDLPLAASAAAIGYLTIGLETLCILDAARRDHIDQMGLDLQMLLANLETFRPDDYLDAQRLRQTLREQVRHAFSDVDVLALPTTKAAAPAITDDEATGGFVDPEALDAMCRYAFIGNLTGIPAGTAPVGRDAQGLPVGLQILGDAWDEASVLAVLAHLERLGVARAERPATAVDILG